MGAITSTQQLLLQVAVAIVLVLLAGFGGSAWLAQRHANQAIDRAVRLADDFYCLRGVDLFNDIQHFRTVKDLLARAEFLEEIARVLATLFTLLLVAGLAARGSLAWVH